MPITSEPLTRGWVDVQDGIVAALGREDGTIERPADLPRTSDDLGDVAILPAFVNAHTHLELSALRGRVPAAAVMADWVRDLMRARQTVAAQHVLDATRAAIDELRSWGVGAVGEVTNSLSTVEPLAGSPLAWRAFHELLGFRVSDGEALIARERERWPVVSPRAQGSVEVAAHAPYSTSPALIAAIARWTTNDPARVTTMHLSESPEEISFLLNGEGPWRRLLDDLGVWNPEWRAPGVGPVAYVEGLGFLGPRTLVVHGAQFGVDDILRVRERGATVVVCPRSNAWTGAGAPPLGLLFEHGARVAMGTDSLASVEDLGLLGELAAARRIAPDVPARWLLRAATLGGAEALGFRHLGAIAPGRRASLIAIAVPASTQDVEEYLVSGIPHSAIRWVDA